MQRRGFLLQGVLAAAAALGLRGVAGAAQSFPVALSDEAWRRKLTPDQYAVLRRAGTERPFSSPLAHETRPGLYACAGCGTPAYGSDTKFDSGTGWPSFWDSLPGAVATARDFSLILPRTEAHCATCGGHLGHVFDDGPAPTGLRHCLNGVALQFRPGASAS